MSLTISNYRLVGDEPTRGKLRSQRFIKVMDNLYQIPQDLGYSLCVRIDDNCILSHYVDNSVHLYLKDEPVATFKYDDFKRTEDGNGERVEQTVGMYCLSMICRPYQNNKDNYYMCCPILKTLL